MFRGKHKLIMETVNYSRNKFYDTGPWCFAMTTVVLTVAATPLKPAVMYTSEPRELFKLLTEVVVYISNCLS
jgi:hypothetical protein